MSYLAKAALILGALLALAKLLEEGFRRLGMPGLLGMILAGLLLGKAGAGLVGEEIDEYLMLFTTIGINMLLFIAGAEELRELELARGPVWRATLLGLLAFAGSAACSAFLVRMLGWSVLEAVIVGTILGAVSVGPMVKVMLETGELSTEAGRHALIAGICAELGAIIAFSMVMRRGAYRGTLEIAAVLVFAYIFGRYIFVPALRLLERELSALEGPFALLIAMVLMVGYMAELTGLSAALISLGLGICAATYLEERPDLLSRLKAFTHGFFEPLFFAGLGLYASIPMARTLALSVLLTGIAAVPKVIVGWRLLGRNMSVLLLSKGGVDAALLLSALYAGLLSSEMYEAVLFSMLLSVSLTGFIPRRRMSRSRMTVGEIATSRDVVVAGTPLAEVLDELISKGALVVIDQMSRPLGLLTVADLVLLEPGMLSTLKVEQLMRAEVPCVHVSEPLHRILSEDEYAMNPLVAIVDNEGKVVKTLSRADLLRILGRRFKAAEKKHGAGGGI